MPLSAMDVFEHQTVAELAAAAARASRVEHSGETLRTQTSAPLTPIQHWFFDQRISRANHWNLPAVFDVRAPIDRLTLAEAFRAVVLRHDALRARFPRGEARAVFVPVEDADVDVEWIDLAAIPEERRAAEFERRATELQTTLDIENGPLFRAAYFDSGPDVPGRLLWVAHHLAVDIVSWRVLAEDLTHAYRAVADGKPLTLPPASSFAQWARRLAEFARSPEVELGAHEWLARVDGTVQLPEDAPRGQNTQATVRSISASLDAEETAMLVREAPRRARVRVNEVLAAALQMAFERWTERADLLIDIEGHGREALFEDVDVARTVGWFTAPYPVRLATEPDIAAGDRLRIAKEALRAAMSGSVARRTG